MENRQTEKGWEMQRKEELESHGEDWRGTWIKIIKIPIRKIHNVNKEVRGEVI